MLNGQKGGSTHGQNCMHLRPRSVLCLQLLWHAETPSWLTFTLSSLTKGIPHFIHIVISNITYLDPCHCFLLDHEGWQLKQIQTSPHLNKCGHIASNHQWDYQFYRRNNPISFALYCSECFCPPLKPLYLGHQLHAHSWLSTNHEL